MKKVVRLDKYLADAGAGTRNDVKKFIKKGFVKVNGTVVKDPGQKVGIGEDEVTLLEESIVAADEFEYFLLHKPSGCVSATEDGKDKTVMEYVPSSRKGLFPVGRLDKDTEGLLLITDDGILAHQLLSPKNHVEKSYYARICGIITEKDIEKVEKGIDIGDSQLTLPGKMKMLSFCKEKGTCEVIITICEGRFHQVKRMVKALGKEVIYLKRISMGALSLPDDLGRGECRLLRSDELNLLKESLLKKNK